MPDAAGDSGVIDDDAGPPTVVSCEAACARLATCGGPVDDCRERCRAAPQASRVAWIECVSEASCDAAARCVLAGPGAANCDTICNDLEVVCAGDLPRPDCAAECQRAVDGFTTCHGELADGVCDVRGFIACLGRAAYPDCEASCAPRVACGQIDAADCLGECRAVPPDDPLAERRTVARAACLADAGDDCDALAACDQSGQSVPTRDEVCRAWLGCDLEWDIPCAEVYQVGIERGDGGEALRCTLDLLAGGCPFDSFEVGERCFNGPSGLGRCLEHCETLGLCDVADAGEQAECARACGRIYQQDSPDADALARFSPQWECLQAADCGTFATCVEQRSPQTACALHCEQLEDCDLGTPDCLAACDTYYGFERYADQRRCVAQAPNCPATESCALAATPPCEDWCDRTTECYGPADRLACLIDCDNAVYQAPDDSWPIIACAISAPECFGDFDAHVVDNCWGDSRVGARCLGFCQARLGCRETLDPADLTACLQRCGAGFEGDDALRMTLAADCLDQINPLNCPAAEACVPDSVEPDCPAICDQLAACDAAVDDCPERCANDPLLRQRAVRAERCLAAADGCGDTRTCFGIDAVLPPPPPSVNDFCAAWDGCGFDVQFDCRELFDVLGQDGEGAVACTLEGLTPCPIDPFEPVDRCWGLGAGPSPACEAYCEADAVCSAAPEENCLLVCNEQGFGDPDRVARVALQRICGTELTCPDFADCVVANGPESICAQHCEALAACDPALDGVACRATCDTDFTRPRHTAWRACVADADDCAAIADCAPDPLPPCAAACAREEMCRGVDNPDCLADCDDRAFRDPLQGARYTTCMLTAADCLSVDDCRFGDPSDGEVICVNYCLAVDDCQPDSERPLFTCLEACATGFGGAEGRAVAQAADCLLAAGDAPGCRALRECLVEPVVDCDLDCADLDRCGVDAPDCAAECAAAGLDRAGCLADARRLNRGCAGVYACADVEPPIVDAACATLCAEQARCGDPGDPLLCGIDCSPADDAVPFQQACAEVARCADLPACLNLPADPAAPCLAPCRDAADCGAFPDVAACAALCTGRVRSQRAPADYIATLGPCLQEADGAACDAEAARACFDFELADCETACVLFDACFGANPDCVFFCEQDLAQAPEQVQGDIDCAVENLDPVCDIDGYFNCQDGF